jgi:hypothetical protein
MQISMMKLAQAYEARRPSRKILARQIDSGRSSAHIRLRRLAYRASGSVRVGHCVVSAGIGPKC